MLPRTPAANALVDLTGPILNRRYSLGGVLGEGSAAILLAAEDLRTGRRVAAKLIQGPDPQTGREMLARERNAALVVHPNVCSLTDFGEQGGVPYLILERLEGETLHEAILHRGQLDFASTIHLFIELLCGLAATHAEGLVHRDVKPTNIFLVRRDGCDPTVKLIDFGVAIKTGRKSTPLAGTPAYMAPEQARSDVVDARSDIFSVGVSLFQAIAGRRPYSARTYAALLASHREPIPDVRAFRFDTPRMLSDVIRRATAIHPDERFASAREMMRALQAIPLAKREEGWDYPTAAPKHGATGSCTRIAVPQPQVDSEGPRTQRMH